MSQKNFSIKKIFSRGLAFLAGAYLVTNSQAWAENAKPDSGLAKVAFVGTVSAADFEAKIKPFYKNIAHCEKCEIVNLTPYNDKSEVEYEKLWKVVLDVSSEYAIIYLHWNEPFTEKNKDLVDLINKKLNQDVILVGYAGQSMSSAPTVPLNKSVLGQVHQALIVGELTERERLLPQLYYGPEMITAVRPPKEYLEQGLAPLLFVSSLAKSIQRRKIQDWPDYLRRKKSKNKKLWPDIQDLF